MKRFLLIALAAFSLGGCETAKLVVTPLPTQDLAKAAYTAKAAYAAVLVVAVAYNKLPRCTPTLTVCSDPVVVVALRKASDAADTATQAAENIVRSMPAQTSILAAAVSNADAAVSAMKTIVAAYNIK